MTQLNSNFFFKTFKIETKSKHTSNLYGILRQKQNSKAEKFAEIDYKVVQRLFNDIKKHIEKPWSNVQEKMIKEGIII